MANVPNGSVKTRQNIRKSAIRLFAKQGYSGTPLRQVSKTVGIQMASLYYYFDSKQSLLLDIMKLFMDDISAAIAAATSDKSNPVNSVRETVRIFVLFHGTRPDEAFITDSELRSVEGKDRLWVEERRKQYTFDLAAHIQTGIDLGVFDCSNAKLAAIAILSQCSTVCTWYRPKGKLSLEEIAESYSNFACNLLRFNETRYLASSSTKANVTSKSVSAL